MSATINELPVCPTTCSGALETVSFNECAPEVHFGEITKIYLWIEGPVFATDAPFISQAQYDSIAHWNLHLDNTGTDLSDIRYLTVIGEMPEPEQTETPISGDRTVVGYKKFTVNFEIDETNDINYQFIWATECNGKYKANFETADGIVYGGYLGLDVSVRMNQPIPKSRQEVVKITGKMTWSSKNHPFRQLFVW
jgi:hypothetical protein